MKKLLIMVIAFMMLTSSLVVNASQGPGATANEKGSAVQSKFDNFISDVNQRQEDRIQQFSSQWEQGQENRDKVDSKFLNLVETYTPEMLDQYTTSFDAHNALHQDLLTARNTIYINFTNETNAQLQILKADIDAKLLAKEITIKEARAEYKTFLDQRKDTIKAETDAYQAAIADEKAAQEIRIEEAKTIRTTLKQALEDNDTATITASITTLYTYLEEHIAFDQFKLDTMNSIFQLNVF